MSENVIEYHFVNEKKPKTIKSLINKVNKLHSDLGIEISEISSGREKADFYISMWMKDLDNFEVIKSTLDYLSEFPGDLPPFAKLSIDQTGDEFYYTSDEGALLIFEKESELLSHNSKLGEPSVENNFYEQVKKCKSNMLLKIRFSKKTQMNSLSKQVSEYINDRTEDNFLSVRKIVQSGCRVNMQFPVRNAHRKQNGSEIEYFKSVIFCEVERNNLYLGFEFETDVRIEPVMKRDAHFDAEKNIINDEGLIILEMLECFCYMKESKGIAAKFNSKSKGFGGVFRTHDGAIVHYSPYRDSTPLPAKLW